MPADTNPLVDNRLVDFLLYDLLDVEKLCELPYFEHHDKDTFTLYLEGVRRFSRKELFPTYKLMDEEPPVFENGQIKTHPALPALWNKMIELGVLGASGPEEIGGQQLPTPVKALASAYLMAGNLSAYGFIGLTEGAGGLVHAFGSDELKARFLGKMFDGSWSGTMALTEPHAGSNLGEITSAATPTDGGYYLLKGSKIFISGANNTVVENTVHLALARIDGAPSGTKGISLFAVPNRREEDGKLVPNDVTVSGLIHKIGWKALPSLAIEFGDENHCHGWLVGEPHQGLRYMFKMMNEARIMVGMNSAATASVAYHEAVGYALERKQGRKLGTNDAAQVPIIEHVDVRRMLLRQKAIVDGSFGLLAMVAQWIDIADRGGDADRERAQVLVDLLTLLQKPSRRKKVLKPMCSQSRCTAVTATRANISRNRSCATKNSTRCMKAPPEFRAWICLPQSSRQGRRRRT